MASTTFIGVLAVSGVPASAQFEVHRIVDDATRKSFLKQAQGFTSQEVRGWNSSSSAVAAKDIDKVRSEFERLGSSAGAFRTRRNLLVGWAPVRRTQLYFSLAAPEVGESSGWINLQAQGERQAVERFCGEVRLAILANPFIMSFNKSGTGPLWVNRVKIDLKTKIGRGWGARFRVSFWAWLLGVLTTIATGLLVRYLSEQFLN